jgi:retron-type reverse transcriptase
VLARLCCYTPEPLRWGDAAAPQGAPTSPALSNLVCRRLDARLAGLAARKGAVYTRYADDLTFSFRKDPGGLGRFRWWVDQVCHQEGFFVNERKFRVIRAAQRQLVTGLVVNDELRVPREARRRFRAVLFNCRAHGVASQARGNPRFGDYLRGFASYVHMVHPEEGEELLRQVDALLGPEAEGEGDARE